MADGGYTSSEGALEAKRGWAMVVGANKPEVLKSLDEWTSTDSDDGLAGVTKGKGRWEILRNSFKPFPCGIVIHPIIDACIQLHDDLVQAGHYLSDIESVTAQVHPLVLELTGKKTPRDGLEAKFSVYHSGACGLLFGKATPAEYEDSVVLDRSVIAIRDRISANIDTSLDPDAAVVSVTLRTGGTFTKKVDHAVGSKANPLGDDALKTKFLDGCKSVALHDSDAVSEKCWALQQVEDMRDLAKFL
jgi:2-methylcitrate dehydratase PrpD